MEAARDERGRDDNEELRGRLWQEVARRRTEQARTSAECAARCECSTVEKGELVKLPNCVHHIHLDCLIQLAATGAGQCPLCRKPTTTSSEAAHQVSQLRVQTRLLIESRMSSSKYFSGRRDSRLRLSMICQWFLRNRNLFPQIGS